MERQFHQQKNNIKIFKDQKENLEKAEAQRLLNANSQAKKISEKIFTIKVPAGDSGKLFGSVGTKEISKVIEVNTGINIEKKYIKMP